MTNQNNAAQAANPQTVLSFDERERILCQFIGEPINHDREMAIAIESAVLSKLRAPVADERQPDGKRPDLDWIEGVCVTDTVGRGWCVRIDGTDIFEDVNRYGCKGRRSFQIAADLPSKQEAERAAVEWLDRQRAALASAPVADGWQPIDTAPAGQRVLLGPRRAPVVGIVKHYEDPDSDKPAIVCNVVHYNDTVLVADYHCSEWAPLASAPVAGEAQQESAALRQARHDTANAQTDRERIEALAYWLDQQKSEPEMLSCAAATLRAMLTRDAAPQASAEPAQPCSCPSGDGSLRHPCAVHPTSATQPEQGERDA